MVFKLHINTDNAAFDDGNKGHEVARILRELADKLESDGLQWCYQNLKDINGNIVGGYAEKENLHG